jgi:hypothetical protein
MEWLTDIFDSVLHNVLDFLSEQQQYIVVRNLMVALEGQGWCCHDESAFYNTYIVQAVIGDLHPDWFQS